MSLKKKKSPYGRKMLASRDEATDIPCSVLALNCIVHSLINIPPHVNYSKLTELVITKPATGFVCTGF